MLPSLFKILIAKLTSPTSLELGLTSMGLGIEKRKNELSPFWENHLAQCKKTQAHWLENKKVAGTTLVVLGAGRLYDFNHSLLEAFSHVVFVDGDSLSKRVWQKTRRNYPDIQFQFEITDISGALIEWKKLLEKRSSQQSWDLLLKEIETIHIHVPLSETHLRELLRISKETKAYLLSLNILSQLPIVWQDIVEKILITKFGRKNVREREKEWMAALNPSARALVGNHLAQIKNLSPLSTLIISDVEYATYEIDTNTPLSEIRATPLLFQNNSWVRNEQLAKKTDLQADIVPALFGTSLQETTKEKLLLEWLWHIAPQGYENKKKGVIHRVNAVEISY